jgi:hypothetical protein
LLIFVQQLVRLLKPARGVGTAARLPVFLLPFCDAGNQGGVMSGTEVTGLSLHPGYSSPMRAD